MTRARDGLVLLVSALVVIGGAAVRQRAPPSAPAASSAGPGLPPPLPSGAPMRAFEELPADDERAAGCRFADRGFGDYGGWRKLPLGRALVPAGGRALAGDGTFRLLVHFHGAEPVRRQLAPEGMDLVIAAVDAGVGSRAYERALADPDSFGRLVAAIEAEVAAESRAPGARARSIVLSAWSAGYGAVGQVLGRGVTKIAAVVLLDALYAAYAGAGHTIAEGQLAQYVEAARAARGGGPTFFLTHTAIATPGYASTAEVASFLLGALGATAAAIDEAPAGERFPLTRVFEEGRLAIRGYAGADRDAHCAQLHLLPSVLRERVLPEID